MSGLELFFILWFFVFPILGITESILIPVLWFFVVPKISRKLAWDRFRKVSYHMLADDTGYCVLVSTNEELPEGVVRTRYGWRFLPRPLANTDNPGDAEKDKDEALAEAIMLRKFTWKDMGKPLWFGYLGKIGSMNPASLGALQQDQDTENISQAMQAIQNMEEYVKTLPKELITHQRFGKGHDFPHLRKDLTDLVKSIREEVKIQPYTVLDPTRIKEIMPKMWTPTQIEALARNREEVGRKKAGKQYGGLILGGALLLGLVAIVIVAILVLPGLMK